MLRLHFEMVALMKQFIWCNLKTVSNDSKFMVCKLKKSIYYLKYASLISSCGFKANIVDDCVYHKFSKSKYILLILRYRSQDILRLSQENYINKVLNRFDMKDSKLGDTLIAKGDKFSFKKCLNNDFERNEMQKIPYASIVGSLMYT
ncbi:hypothetical protein CR513_22571, partial [Mucuna pruriens]